MSREVPCSACHGAGWVWIIVTHEDGTTTTEQAPCTVCGGSGRR